MPEEVSPHTLQIVDETRPPIPKLPDLSPEEIKLAELKLPRKYSTIRHEYDDMDLNSMPAEERVKIAEDVWHQAETAIEKIIQRVDEKSSHGWREFAQEFWSKHREQLPNFEVLGYSSENLRRYCSYIEYLSSAVDLFDQAGFIGNVIGRDPQIPCHNSELYKLGCSYMIAQSARLESFRRIVSDSLLMNSAEDPYNTVSGSLFQTMNDEINELRIHKLGWEPVGESSDLKVTGFSPNSIPETLAKSTIHEIFTKSSLAHVSEIKYDPDQPPEEVDKDGKVWAVGGDWSDGGLFDHRGKATLYPASCASSQLFVSVLMHELGGHGLDEITKAPTANYKVHTVPPWILIRMLETMDQFDPIIKPATDYVAKVAAEEIGGNVRDIQQYLVRTSWVEQLAEMMTIFRLNPVQFATEFGEEAFKSFAMYCTAVDGDGYEGLQGRLNKVINHHSLIYGKN